jgi:hypothetical protein
MARKQNLSQKVFGSRKVSPSTIAPSVSGTYILLDREDKLPLLSRRMEHFKALKTELAQINESLRQCNDPAWLDKLAKRLRNKGRNFEKVLTELVGQLEQRKLKTVERMDKLRGQFYAMGLPDPDTPVTRPSRASGRQATKVYSGRGSRHCYAIK